MMPDSETLPAVQEKPHKRRIWVTVALNLLEPGLPLIYCGNLKAGIGVALGFTALWNLLLLTMGIFCDIGTVIGTLAVWILAFIAILIYNIRYTVRANRAVRRRLRGAWLWIISVFVITTVINQALGTLIKRHIVEAYKISSAGMANTLQAGDYLLASKGIDLSSLNRGDIIIFKYPLDLNENYVKRIVALPGDKVRIVNKRLCLNGEPVPLPPEGQFIDSAHVCPHSDDRRWGPGNRDNMPELTVPQGQLFVLGDNRDNSADSRFWGFLDEKLVVGKARFVHFSWDAERHRVRWERMGKRLDR
jgi:signal peptidase I